MGYRRKMEGYRSGLHGVDIASTSITRMVISHRRCHGRWSTQGCGSWTSKGMAAAGGSVCTEAGKVFAKLASGCTTLEVAVKSGWRHDREVEPEGLVDGTMAGRRQVSCRSLTPTWWASLTPERTRFLPPTRLHCSPASHRRCMWKRGGP